MGKEVTLNELLYQTLLDSFTSITQEVKCTPIENGYKLEYDDLYCVITEKDLTDLYGGEF